MTESTNLIVRSLPPGPREARPDDKLRKRLEGWTQTHGLAAILRDAAKTPLLRMRSEIASQPLRMTDGDNVASSLREVIDLAHPGAHVREHVRQHGLDLLDRHAGLDPGVVEHIEDVLVVDVEKAHRDVVVEHGPGHAGSIVDRPQRLQQFLIGAIEEDEVAIIDGEDHVGMFDLELFVLAEA